MSRLERFVRRFNYFNKITRELPRATNTSLVVANEMALDNAYIWLEDVAPEASLERDNEWAAVESAYEMLFNAPTHEIPLI